jgi:hypothetical protein
MAKATAEELVGGHPEGVETGDVAILFELTES